MSAACCDQPPVHIVVWCRSESNLLSHWCDSAIDDIHDIEPGYVRLRTGDVLLLLGLLVQMMTLLRRCCRCRRLLHSRLHRAATALVVQAGQRGDLCGPL